jgi:hypothetical protein
MEDELKIEIIGVLNEHKRFYGNKATYQMEDEHIEFIASNLFTVNLFNVSIIIFPSPADGSRTSYIKLLLIEFNKISISLFTSLTKRTLIRTTSTTIKSFK